MALLNPLMDGQKPSLKDYEIGKYLLFSVFADKVSHPAAVNDL